MFEHINVEYDLHTTDYSIKQALSKLDDLKVISFDCETQSIYSKTEKEEAKELLNENMTDEHKRLCKLVIRSSGLSNPRLIKVTHFIFGISRNQSVIMLSRNRKTEVMIYEWLARFKGKVIMWNALFDAKIMYDRINTMPIDYEDGMLLLKSLINDTQTWNAKTGLKDFMGKYYSPDWTLETNYDNPDYKDKSFIKYCSIDGASTFYAWELLQEQL